VGHLLLFECPGDYSVNLTTGVKGGVSDQAHQSDVTSAVDEGDVALGQQPSQIHRSLATCRIEARARPAEDTDRLDRRHGRTIGDGGSPSRRSEALVRQESTSA
jgi:hypothetical protein